ncbi:hypothetical protein NKG05_23290 [Oerskovia sp. M15]
MPRSWAGARGRAVRRRVPRDDDGSRALLDSRRYREVLSIAAFVPLMLAARSSAGPRRPSRGVRRSCRSSRTLSGGRRSARPGRSRPRSPTAPGASRSPGSPSRSPSSWWRGWSGTARWPGRWSHPRRGVRRQGQGARLVRPLPATPVGAVAARCLTYWFRDPRYSGSIAVIPLLPVVLWFVGSSMDMDGSGTGFREILLILGPITAFTFGFAISADVAYDHTAFWTQVSSGVHGFADRAGRVIAAAVLGVPVVVIFAVASVAFAGRWDLLVATVGLSLGVLATGLGVSSVVSARLLYPVPKPGRARSSRRRARRWRPWSPR